MISGNKYDWQRRILWWAGRASLLCCKERMHFGAMYSQTYSHRDIPMRNEQVLQVLMQTSEMQTAVEEWGG